jgi:antitoxin HigA-1
MEAVQVAVLEPRGRRILDRVKRRRITAETALRLARYFNTNAEFWLNLQNFFDLEVTRRSGKISEIERQVHPAPALVS